jgi:hypothetical protein
VQGQGGNNDEGLSSGSIIAIAVTLGLAAVCCAVVGLFYWRIKVARKRAAIGLKPVDQSIALQDRAPVTAGTTAAAARTTDTAGTSDATQIASQGRTPNGGTQANEGTTRNEGTATDTQGTARDGSAALTPAYGDSHLQMQHIRGDPPPYSP